ncbi:DUF4190 domain-containing protein [Fictibacillus sp. 5RED26]|uniref:DUF4190 domain-containing protein n=1 Tax=unclassified Fictibacillus TaxID=2644029 RepID=UPI0018CCB7BB|nr:MULTISPECIES: DUF4190 domain-containing protein [unclassified Fictibacillus]MBH0158466.1 DUF4190 domain-containing protein [Fictibacillus sp. 5RED26]MBH0174611.1 DUF4190 domain-containing protein [Fictibacillus sp. 23RED33]
MAYERDERTINNEAAFREEMAAEAVPVPVRSDMTLPENERPRYSDRDDHRHEHEDSRERAGGKATGIIAIILSVLSLFILPVLFGAAGIIVGFIARRQGAHSLGNWAIGIGVVSIIISLFFAPFF